MGAAAVLLQVDSRAMWGALERGSDIAIGLSDFGHHVALAAAMGERRARRKRCPAVRHRRERLVVDRDQRGGVLRQKPCLGNHHRHRFADEGHLILGQYEGRDVGWKLRRAKLQRQPLLRQLR